jgi:triacylglycerol esterase/lipase EstA (alpha/beta hydrolase family)
VRVLCRAGSITGEEGALSTTCAFTIGRRAPGAFALALTVALLALLGAPGSARAIAYAPVDHPGPALDVPVAALSVALQCSGSLGGAAHSPVLLIPGTTLNPNVEYSWSWEPALRKLGWPFCALTLPGNAMADIQDAAEYVVYAIRSMAHAAGKRIDVLGHSQGGMIGRWALRFWPDTRALVDDLVGLAPSNHGTLQAIGACSFGCAPAFWQQRTNAAFIAALNSAQETFPGISYTDVYTHLDEVVTPNLNDAGSSSLHGGGGQITNVAVQDACPASSADHLAVGSYDPVAYALAIDALSHPGPAVPSRVSPLVCTQTLQPGVDPATFPSSQANELAFITNVTASYPRTPSEPPLRCYVTASCPATAGQRRARRPPQRHRRARRPRSHRVLVPPFTG